MDTRIIIVNGLWRDECPDAETARHEASRLRRRLASQGYYDAEVRVLTVDEYREHVRQRKAAREQAWAIAEEGVTR